MTTIVTRAGKGSALTFAEMDANLTNLNNDKVEANTNATFSGVTVTGLSGIVKASTGALGPAVSGTDIKTINSTSLLGSGDVSVGTVTSVAALTIGTTGTDLSSSVATGTTTPTITLNVPTASATNRGALTSTDWSTFNNKQATLVSGTNIKTVNSTSLLGSGDIAVQPTLVSGTNIKTINGNTLLGSGDLVLSGTGDLVGPASSVDSQVMLFNGSTGKLAKAATNTGLLKAASGVLATATSGTDYSAGTSALATGILKSTTTTGTLSIAASGTDYAPATSGTSILKGSGSGGFSNATAGTDYLAPPSGTSILKANSGGALANATAGTDYQAAITATGILKGAGAGSVSAGTAGTDYVAPGTTTEFTKPQRPSVTSETAPSSNTVTWDLTTNEIFRVNLNANITTFNLTGTLANLAGYQYEIIVRYNGGTTITWNSNFKWTGGTAPTLTGTSGKVDILTFVVASTDGTNFYLLNTGIKQNIG